MCVVGQLEVSWGRLDRSSGQKALQRFDVIGCYGRLHNVHIYDVVGDGVGGGGGRGGMGWCGGLREGGMDGC